MTSRDTQSARLAPFPADHATAGYPTYPVAGTRGVAGVCEAAMRAWDAFVVQAGIRGEVP
jgi:hypothetical protein